MARALEGVRVLDWTVGQAGPVAAMMLGDLGADVIKIEGPRGDHGRNYTLKYHCYVNRPGEQVQVHRAERQGRNSYFEFHNHNKRGIALDFKKPGAKEIFYRLVEKSDVVLQNFRTGVSKRLGVDYDTLSKVNPRLIYASSNVMGSRGPEATKPGLDLLGTARSGLMLCQGHPDWEPVYTPGAIGDQMCGIMLSYGILAALVARDRLGIGQEVKGSLLGSMIALQGMNVMSYLIMGHELGRRHRKNEFNPMYNYYKCSDGRWIALAMSSDAPHWHDFCAAMGIEKCEHDPRYESPEARRNNHEELTAILDEVFASKPSDQWLQRLATHGDLRFTYLQTIEDLDKDPQVIENNYIVEFEHPVWGKIKEVLLPLEFSKTPASITREAPEYGQHTEEVLMEVLGYTWDDISQLKEKGTI